jgi:flavodoxin
MVLYFSATGNTKYIAEELARILDDNVLDLREKIRRKDYTPILSKKPFVICSPV